MNTENTYGMHILVPDHWEDRDDIHVPFESFNPFVVTEPVTMLVQLTVDDEGALHMTPEGGTGKVVSISAALPEGEWERKGDPDYWQSSEIAQLEAGRYTCGGFLHNKQNESRFVYYAINFTPVAPLVVEVDSCPEPPRTVCCKQQCSCGGNGENGNLYKGAIINLCQLGEDTCAADAEIVPDIAASTGPGVVPNKLIRRSIWDWNATLEGDTLNIETADKCILPFNVDWQHGTASPTGTATNLPFQIQLLDDNFNPCTSGNPAYYMLCDDQNCRVVFSASTGKPERVISADDKVVTAAQYNAGVVTRFDASGNVVSCYSARDGLMLAAQQDDGSLNIAYFAPSAVTVNPDGTYTTTGDPFRTQNFRTVRDNDGRLVTTITRRQGTLPATIVTRTVEPGKVTIVQGSGNEAIQQTFQGYQAPNNMRYVIETVEKEDNSAPAINTITEEQLTSKGLCRLHHTDGRGSDVAQVTSYNYDENARLSRVNRPDGSYTRYEYDTLGRVVLEAEPWAGGGEKVTTTTYSTARFFDCRPASIEVSYHNNTVSTETRTYEDSAAVNRMTVNTTANGMTRTRVVETYGRTPAYAYAAGRVKSVTDVSGVQTIHEYAATAAHGAVHLHTVTTKAAGVLVAGQSTRREEYIAADDTVVFMQESVWDGSDWQLLSTTAAQYDEQHRRTRTTHGNGRFSTKTWMCCGVLSETDEDGVQTDYAYDSAQQLVETTRAAVYDGDTCITPETITEYVRDAAGRVIITTTRAGALTTVTCTAYDAVGRVVAQTDALGRTTTTAYSADGLTTTQTTPSGATLVTTRNTDGSTAHVSGTGQRELKYAYDVSSGRMRTTVRLADDSILSQTLENGFGETVVETAPSTTGFIYTRSEYNNRAQLTRRYQDTSMGATPTASTLYEYDAFGNLSRQTLALDEEPSPLNSPVVEFAYGVEEGTDGIYSVTTRTRYNAAGTALTSTRKVLISSLSSTLAIKSVAIDERGLTSTEWTEYGVGTVKDSYSSVPTSSITAHQVMVDGFTVSHSDHAGVASTQSRRFTETGMELTHTDGRGNATTTRTDIAGRTVSVTDAAGNTSTTAYNPYFDEPSVVTDACGKTACYKYDIRGRKVAEWGTAIQPACFGYDDADRMTSLATFRAGMETISTDPSSRTDGDVTTWAYHATTGLEVSKTYADGKGTVKTYDAFNRLATETDARGKVKNCSYEHARGLLLEISYSDDTPTESFVYNHLGQLTLVTDSAGIRAFGYNAYGEQETDSLLAEGVTHLVTETRDSFGRSTGYTYTKGDATQQTVTTAYGTDGRISGAGFIHGGQEKQFGYTYLQGSHLLQTLTKPNGMTLTQTYEQHRDLLTQMDYKRGNTLVARRAYQYDTLGRPTSRTLARQGATRNDVFTYNDRSELISDVVDGTGLNGWDYDNIGNRLVQQQGSACDTYTSNQLNQYTAIEDESHDVFTPTYDDDGNQTRIKTSTGIWDVTYNAKNRPVLFSKEGEDLTVACTYDYMGRRATKVVTENGQITSSHRFLYRGYLQIACCDRKRATHPCLWLITWDPTQDVATRPLAIQKDGTWYTYGWDLTKNIWEAYTTTGYISTAYTYTAYGQVTASGSITQPIQWSSEYNDTELALVYYNYRHYNSVDGRWLGRDALKEEITRNNLYSYVDNACIKTIDYIGLKQIECTVVIIWGHGYRVDRYIEKNYHKYDASTCAFGAFGCHVSSVPPGYKIANFPDLRNCFLGVGDRDKEENRKGNAGLNPNKGRREIDRKIGFSKVLDKALKSAKTEAESICKKSCCESVAVIFKGIGKRSGSKGTKVLSRRLSGTNSPYKKLSSKKKIKVDCKKIRNKSKSE